jgi:hypothetical protein
LGTVCQRAQTVLERRAADTEMPFEVTHNSPPPRPRPCPVCGVAMVGAKLRNDGKRFDLFRCLQCSTVIDLSGSGALADTPDA